MKDREMNTVKNLLFSTDIKFMAKVFAVTKNVILKLHFSVPPVNIL